MDLQGREGAAAVEALKGRADVRGGDYILGVLAQLELGPIREHHELAQSQNLLDGGQAEVNVATSTAHPDRLGLGRGPTEDLALLEVFDRGGPALATRLPVGAPQAPQAQL